MDQVKLSAEARTESGSRPARRMRREGRVPANIYGRGMDATPVSVDGKDLYSVLHTDSGLNALINVEIEGKDPLLTVAREIQRHPVRGDISHLDFIRVALDEAIVAEVGLEPTGIPVGVHEEGGFVEAIATTVSVSALPLSIPTSIEYDISALHIGDTLKISDLPELDGVEYLDDPEHPILTVAAPRLEEEEEVVDELEEGEVEEGEEPDEEAAEEPADEE